MDKAKRILEEALSYKNCDGLIEENSRLEDAVLYAINKALRQPPDAKHLLADSASIKDLIHRDISRCNDDRCPTAPFCERYLQMAIDYKKGEKLVSVTDFKGREKVGLCDHFINVGVV